MKATCKYYDLLSSPVLLFFSFVHLSFPTTMVLASVRFDDSARIECTGLEALLAEQDYLPSHLQNWNCSTYVEDSQRLCRFSFECAGFANIIDCDHDADSGKVSAVRYVFGVLQKCGNTAGICGDNCIGSNGNKAVHAWTTSPQPIEMFCPANNGNGNDNDNYARNLSCSYNIQDDEQAYTRTTTNSSGTFYSINSQGVGAVCDQECSVKGYSSDAAYAYTYTYLLLSTFCWMLLI
jgi:hypothetical protein